MSKLALNNSFFAQVPDATPPTTGPAKYRYKVVLNKGSICYDFMNKGTGGAKIELVVYRMKKNQKLSIATGDMNMSYMNDFLTQAIGNGYLDTVLADAGTDNLGGRPPKAADILDNAEFPFLPLLKATKQATQPIVEIQRQTFAMPSGSRREVNIDLPGIVYDPLNQQFTPQDIYGLSNSYASIFDEYTYFAMISVCGVVCTRELTTVGGTDAGTEYNIGDMISRANIQFYATYTEHIGACCYSDAKKNIMYSAGSLVDTDTNTGFTRAPVTMLAQSSAIRTPATGTSAAGTGGIATNTKAGTNLTADFAFT